MRALPSRVKLEIRDRLWKKADQIDWLWMNVIEKARQYGVWTEDPDIGGVLSGYMDARNVKTYIKDTLMKPYARASMAGESRILKLIGEADGIFIENFERPHGGVLRSNRVVCWGKADDWKLVLMAVHERAFTRGKEPYAAVLMPPLTRFIMPPSRQVVHDAAEKLGIQKLEWLDPRGEMTHDNELFSRVA